MTFLPIVGREMRGAARQTFTFYLRVLGGAFAIVSLAVFVGDRPLASSLGGELFRRLHTILFCAVWILVPFLTADTISRERREGTLSLLFLTLLRAWEIVLAKSVAEGLRALTLWLAVVPVVAVPVLLGGVGPVEALVSITVTLSSICLALSAGLIASAWNRQWARSITLAVVLAAAFLLVQAFVAGSLFVNWFSNSALPKQASTPEAMLGLGFALLLDSREFWTAAPGILTAGGLNKVVFIGTVFSFLVLFLAVLLAGDKTNRSWRDPERSRRQAWLERVFCTPVLWLGFLRVWLRRRLERNPLGWLEQRQWSGRLVTWAWLAVVVSVTTALLSDATFYRDYREMLRFLAWLLAVTIGITAAGSFRRERDNGVLELLLVSPLGESSLAWGRLRGIWTQFLPAAALLFGVWIYFETVLGHGSGKPSAPLPIAASMLALMLMSMAGLYFSVRTRNFLPATVLTLLVGLLGPAGLARVSGSALSLLPGWWPGMPFVRELSVLFQVALAAILWRALLRRLRDRRFPLARPAAL